MTTTRIAALACGILMTTSTALAGLEDGSDWPRWRGAEGTGISSESGWSPSARETSLWTKDIGFGHSSFAVANGRLYTMGYDQQRGLDIVHCLDPKTGDEIWSHSYPAEFWNEGHDGGTCTTPTVDGDTIFTSNREGRLLALRADTGSVRWQHDMREELGVTPPRWGFSGSPIVVNNLVVANVGKLAAYDKATGEHKWTSERELGNAYSTPVDYDWFGKPCVLVFNGLGLAAIDARDGSELAFHPWTRNPERAVYGATPVIVDDHIFISASSGGGCAMLKPKEDGTFEVAWESRVMRNDYTGCVLYEDHLYGFDASILKCIDLEGNEKWRKRGIGLGAVVVVGGRLLILGAKGELIIAEATPEEYVELSRQDVLDGGAYWSTPVLSHGLVYARNSLGDMVCRDYRPTAAVADAGIAAPAALPAAETLLAGHVRAIGGVNALRALTDLHLSGTGDRQGGGGPSEHCEAQLSWSSQGAFVWRFSSGFDFGFNSRFGWDSTMRGPVVLEGEQLGPFREVGDLHRPLQSNWGFTSIKTTGARTFDDRMCYVVEAELSDGAARTLYFDAKTGLLAGQEGENVPLWVFDEYTTVNNVKVPMEWSFFAPGNGAMTSAAFTRATANKRDASRLAPPRIIQIRKQSAEELDAADAALRKQYEYLVGNYRMATGNMKGAPVSISIDGGAIRMSGLSSGPPDYMDAPDEQGRIYSMTNRAIYVQLSGHEDKKDFKLVVWGYDAELGALERVD